MTEKALLAYRNTALETGFSPAELLYGRKLRDTLPFTRHAMVAKPNLSAFPEMEGEYRARYKRNYDRRHRCHELEPLRIGEFVWISDLKRHGQVVAILKEPRSYLIKTEKQTVRRNRYHLIPAPYLDELPGTVVDSTPVGSNESDASTPAPQASQGTPVAEPAVAIPTAKNSRTSVPSKPAPTPKMLRPSPVRPAMQSVKPRRSQGSSTSVGPASVAATRSGRPIVRSARFRQNLLRLKS
uniref:Uncharacterized protein n=1 Tax=Lygus hesperus TaxID=30085 RepID=A0A0A9XJB5_LYGHE